MGSIPVIPMVGDQQAAISTFTNRVYEVNEDGTIGKRLDHILDEFLAEIEKRAYISQLSNPNLLDNWYFTNLVNQLGQSTYTYGYGFDRWMSWDANSEVSLQENYIRIMRTTWMQKIEKPSNLSGKTVTISAIIRGSGTMKIYSVEAAAELGKTEFVGIADWQLMTATFKMPTLINDNAQLSYELQPLHAESLDTLAAKLELGPIQTLAHQENGRWVLNDPPPNPQQELAKCQRYQCTSYPKGIAPGTPNAYANEIVMVAVTTNRFSTTSLDFPVTMATTPSVVFYSPNTGSVDKASKAGGGEATVSKIITGQDRVAFYAPNNDLVPGSEYYIHYFADANL